jgi:hypothetical protein
LDNDVAGLRHDRLDTPQSQTDRYDLEATQKSAEKPEAWFVPLLGHRMFNGAWKHMACPARALFPLAD